MRQQAHKVDQQSTLPGGVARCVSVAVLPPCFGATDALVAWCSSRWEQGWLSDLLLALFGLRHMYQYRPKTHVIHWYIVCRSEIIPSVLLYTSPRKRHKCSAAEQLVIGTCVHIKTNNSNSCTKHRKATHRQQLNVQYNLLS